MNRSIKSINLFLFIVLINMNGLFFMFDNLIKYRYIYLLINILLLIMFFIFNKIFEIEEKSRLDVLYKLNNSILLGNSPDIKKLLDLKFKFKENNDIYRILKDEYIRKSLVTKDYNEFKDFFGKLIPKDLLVDINEKGINNISPGISIKKYLNIMFLDIIGFTSIAEELSPDNTLLLLNIYFNGIVEIINKNGGYVDKFLGDGLMAVFEGINSEYSIKASIEIQNFLDKFKISEIGKKISIGIGINSGKTILGIVGSSKRMDITIIGDVVNVASRLESLTRKTTNKIIISECTYINIINKDRYVFKDLGFKSLRGKKTKVKIYEVESIIKIKL